MTLESQSVTAMPTPAELWFTALWQDRYWTCRRRLRQWSDDCQIVGHEYCLLGILCDIYIKHAPEAQAVGARWGRAGFEWLEGAEIQKENLKLPTPVKNWWMSYHPNLDIEKLAIIANDQYDGNPKMFALLLKSMMGGKPQDLVEAYSIS